MWYFAAKITEYFDQNISILYKLFCAYLNDSVIYWPCVVFKGSGVIKAGFAGDQVPKCHFAN